jgi:probable HAF family extracellular repeat protein
MKDLGTLGGDCSYAWDINEIGQVVGFSTTASGLCQAFLWTEASGMVYIGTLGGPESNAFAINNRGEVVGCSINYQGGEGHAFLWKT